MNSVDFLATISGLCFTMVPLLDGLGSNIDSGLLEDACAETSKRHVEFVRSFSKFRM